MLLAFAASLLAGVFLIFALGSYYVNVLQKRNVQAAIELAQEQARKLARDVLELMTSQDSDSMSGSGVRDQLRPMTQIVLRQNRNVVWAGVFDSATGTYVVEQSSGDEQTFRTRSVKDEPYSTQIPSGSKSPIEVSVKTAVPGTREIRQKIEHRGRQLGEIRMRIAENPTFERIETTSKQITGALVAECVLLLVFLIVVFAVLWRLVSRQLSLMQHNAELDRMAYVGTLASGLAHEIRNPLSAMNVNLAVIREELCEPHGDSRQRALGLAGRVQREVEQLNTTLTSFLDFALPSRESTTRFALRALAEELLEAHAEELRQEGVTWELVAPPSRETMVEADRRLIHQTLRNLLVNAQQAVNGSVKKHVRVQIEPLPRRRIRLIVADTGPGISTENLDRIFEVFFSTRKGGSGFGLAIARKIVEEHEGAIRAENNVDSRGASFIVELPVDAAVEP
jgi:signal transduction histidine kinase